MKHIWEFWFSNNMVDILFWLACLTFAIRYGILEWKKNPERAQGFLLVLFMCFYGGFLIYRLGAMKFVIYQLVFRCNEAGVFVGDLIP